MKYGFIESDLAKTVDCISILESVLHVKLLGKM